MLKYLLVFATISTLLEFLDCVKSHRRLYVPELDYRCSEKETYRENNCNICRCRAGLLTVCTLMSCSGEEYYRLKYCNKVGKKWNVRCNVCECTKEYGTLCTLRECSTTYEEVPESFEYNEDQARQANRDCTTTTTPPVYDYKIDY
ncbi:hypothetical protein ILUMI_02988 [Ignelater luminosus]|uniref:Pacifastin domain-containing protein n=1 Tax=Ignelater luminosus TaxID=2038154 RepID=A0A8K0DH71_IGNLU|nr:hypothetical protein ILUMI_02988 [Ignelater luminosus]